jgi:hypothetical protein
MQEKTAQWEVHRLGGSAPGSVGPASDRARDTPRLQVLGREVGTAEGEATARGAALGEAGIRAR